MKISAFAVGVVAVLAGQSSGFFFRPIPIPLFKPIPLKWNLGGGGGGSGSGQNAAGHSCPTPTCPTPQCPTPVCPSPECPEAPECEQRAQDIDSCESIGMTAVFNKDGSLNTCL